MTQYIVTDPCYILPGNIWSKCCKFLDGGFEAFNQAVSRALTKFTGYKAWACDTGYGDWDNTLYGIPGTITKNSPANDSAGFYADAGMVCVCKLVPDIEDMLPLDEEYGTTTLGAIFEAEGKITVKMDTSDPEWTVVRISDEAGNHWHTMESPFSDDEGECED